MGEIDKNTLVVVLWGLLLILLFWSWLPALIAAMGGTKYENGGSDEATGLEPTGRDPDYQLWYKQAVELGYEPLGTGWTRVRFHGPDWQATSQLRIFRSSAKHSYFIVRREPPPIGMWFHGLLATPLADGGLLSTGVVALKPTDMEAEFIHQGAKTFVLEDLEQLHLDAMAELVKKGRRPEADGTLENLLTTLKRASEPQMKQRGAREGWDYLLLHGIIHFCASIPAGVAFGFDHWSMPFTNLMVWFLLWLSDFVQRKHIAAAMKMAMGALAKRGAANVHLAEEERSQ